MASRNYVADVAKILKKIAEQGGPDFPGGFAVEVKNYEARIQKWLSFYDPAEPDKPKKARVFIEMKPDDLTTDHKEARLLTIDVRDFREEGKAVILTDQSVKLAVIREALTADPDFNLGELPLTFVIVDHDMTPPSTRIILLLDRATQNTHGAPARVLKNCWDLAIETICKMIFNVLPGFEGTKEPFNMSIKKKKNDKAVVGKASSMVEDVVTMEKEKEPVKKQKKDKAVAEKASFMDEDEDVVIIDKEEEPVKKKKAKSVVKKVSFMDDDLEVTDQEEDQLIKKKQKKDRASVKKASSVKDVGSLDEDEGAPVVLGYPVSAEHEGLPVVTGRPLLDY